jgi:hypothetical protein
MKRLAALVGAGAALLEVGLVLMLAGCSIWGPVGEYDGSFHCEGKGTITGNGNINLGAGVGGGQGNGFTIVMDCGDGLTITRERARTHADPATP